MQFGWGEITAAGLLGGLVGAFLTHLLAAERDKQKDRRAAYTAFRQAIAPTIAALQIQHPMHVRGDQYVPVIERLRADYPVIGAAFNVLRMHLPAGDQKKLVSQWRVFCCFDDETLVEPTFSDYQQDGYSHVEELQMRRLAVVRLEALADSAGVPVVGELR